MYNHLPLCASGSYGVHPVIELLHLSSSLFC